RVWHTGAHGRGARRLVVRSSAMRVVVSPICNRRVYDLGNLSMRLIPALLFFCVPLAGQSVDATISGSVTDPRGGAVSAAVVEAQQTGTGVVFKTKSNDAGVYLFPALPFGHYTISAEKPGFNRLVIDGVAVDTGARLRIHLRLEIGAVNESVSVTGDEQIV